MKKYARLTLFGGMLCLLLLIFAQLAFADGSETLGPPSIEIAAGSGIAVSGTGMETQPGVIDVEVPADAVVKQVILYWAGGAADPREGDDSITINGQSVTGTLIGGPAYFYRNVYFTAYRADITNLGLVAPGTNSLTLSDMVYQDGEKNGAGVVVIYDDGAGVSDIQLVDGVDTAYLFFDGDRQATVPQTFTFEAASVDRVADVFVFVGSVKKERPNLIRIEVGDTVTEVIDELSNTSGADWDTWRYSVPVPAGETSITLEVVSYEDGTGRQPASLVWVTAGVTVRNTPPDETSLVCPDFQALPAGLPISGDFGLLHPDLKIENTGETVVLHEGEEPLAYWAPNDYKVMNGGLGEMGGFSDRKNQHDYLFTLLPTANAHYFSVRMLDFGDYNPKRATQHLVALVAYDADGNEVSSDVLEFPSGGGVRGLFEQGDAVSAQPGEPGKRLFKVFTPADGPVIATVKLVFDSNVAPDKPSDPMIGFSNLCWGSEPPPPPPEEVCADFTSLTPGTSVEGLGVVMPNLNIGGIGNVVAAAEDVEPLAYWAPNLAPDRRINGGMGIDGGFFDSSRRNNYEFSFAPGTSLSEFRLRMLDFGDYNPNRAKFHQVILFGYNSRGSVVAMDELVFATRGSIRDFDLGGDAVDSIPGQPGNFEFQLQDPFGSIVRTELVFKSDVPGIAATDPIFGLSDLCYRPTTSP